MGQHRGTSVPPADVGVRSTGGPWRDSRFDPLAWRSPRPRLTPDAHTLPWHLNDRLLVRLAVGSILGLIASGVIIVALLRAGW
jgi:hypothetical protein